MSVPLDPNHSKYRPDIDGLRAVAVLSVVIFHASPSNLAGGFIGVDIFFVISGFLISKIIFENLDKNTFSFISFYSRRIKRIFPALLLVLAFSYALGWFSLFADEYEQLGKHIAGGAGFVANLVLWSEAGYFDNSAETKPLLHLWSLGIEEQFYIIWPLLLWLTRKNGPALATTISLAIASFTLNLANTQEDRPSAFYFPHTRFWELLCGSLLAWLTIHGRETYVRLKSKLYGAPALIDHHETNPDSSNIAANITSLTGLLLLAYGLWRIDGNLDFPGIWATIPVLSAVLLIAAGPEGWVNRYILSSKIAVWFGLISFPLYLWHWPLLSFARILKSGTPAADTRIAAVALSIVLAWLTYKLIERPVRFGKHNRAKVVVLAVLMAIMGYIGYDTYNQDGIASREVLKANPSLDSGDDGGDGGNMIDGCGVVEEASRKLFHRCTIDKRGNVRFALMGDSKADAMYAGLVRTSNSEGRWLFIGGSGAYGAPVPLLASDIDTNRPLTVHAVEAIRGNSDIDTVVLVAAIRSIFLISDGVRDGNTATYDHTYLRHLSTTDLYDITLDEMGRVVNKFVGSGKKVVLVVDNPPLPDPRDCINRRTSLDAVNAVLGTDNQHCHVSIKSFNDQTRLYRHLLKKIQENHPESVKIFDPTDIYCNNINGFCEPTKNGRMMYSYTDHISDYAAGLVGHALNDFLKESVSPRPQP